MIILENRIKSEQLHSLRGFVNNETRIDGYFLTIHDLLKLARDFQADCHDGFISNDKPYIENWLKNHEQIVKKD
jgi:hypothetical protein